MEIFAAIPQQTDREKKKWKIQQGMFIFLRAR